MELTQELQDKINRNEELNNEELEQLNKYIAEREEVERKEEEKRLAELPPEPKEKTQEEKWLDGDEELPPELKIVDGKIENKTQQELRKDGYFTDEQYAEIKRSERDYLLQSTDKYLLADFPINKNDLQIVKNYRQYLRDLPQNKDFPDIEIKTLEKYKGAENGK